MTISDSLIYTPGPSWSLAELYPAMQKYLLATSQKSFAVRISSDGHCGLITEVVGVRILTHFPPFILLFTSVYRVPLCI